MTIKITAARRSSPAIHSPPCPFDLIVPQPEAAHPQTDATVGRTIAIGDVHGCAHALATLVEMIDPQPADVIVCLGDVIDRGPDSRGAVAQFMALRERCRLVCILGNHEQMLLDAIDGYMPVQEWLQHGGAEALDSYGKGMGVNAVDPAHVAFIRTWGDVYETPGEFYVHGNYWASREFDRQPWRDLRWQSLHWHAPGPHRSGKRAIVGHTSNKQGRITNLGHLVCLDTFCCGGEWLTALEPATNRVWQTKQSGETREGKLPPVQKSL